VATGKADAATQSAISGATGDSTSSSAPHSALVPAPRPVSAPAPRLVPAPAPRLVPAPAPRPVPALALHPVPAPALRPVPAPALSPVLAPALSPVPAPALRQPSAALVNPTSTAPGTTVPAAPARPALSASSSNSARLASISQSDLAHLGRTNKPAFFETLRPGAEEIERRFGVPASVTMGQIAYETGYGAHVPGGDSYNLFGHKGVGPAGSVRAASYERNHSQLQVSPFRKYHDFAEAMMDHGQVMAAGYYHRALSTVAGGNADPKTFLRNIEGIYHQDGHQYTSDVMGIIRRYDLERPSES
jgi:flagellum-specific peptidoglycan hydrolase FlgJ